MSKLPNHSLWARATTSAAAVSSSSSRAASVLAKSHSQSAATGQTRAAWSSLAAHGQGSAQLAAPTQTQAPTTAYPLNQHGVQLSSNEAAILAALGGVSAPYYGPQPAAVVLAFEQRDAHQAAVPSSCSSPSSSTDASTGATASLPSLVSTFAAFNVASTVNSSHLLATPALRNIVSQGSGGVIAPRPHRPFHAWSHSYRATPASTPADGSAQPRVALSPAMAARRRANAQLLFDITDTATAADVKGKAPQRSSASTDADLDRLEEFFTSLWTNAAREPGAAPSRLTEVHWRPVTNTRDGALVTENGVVPLASALLSEGETASSSRSPSPKSSQQKYNSDVGPRGLHQDVREPPPKFAVTTSSESSLSSTGVNDGGSGVKGVNQVAATSSAAPTAGSSAPPSTLPHDGGMTDQWARHFNIPRSYKRHDFMFEHGAYGIPKRHPLSSIRHASLPSSQGRAESDERRTPSRDQVPSSKVKAATDMLSAAAEFLAGSQSPPSSSSKDIFRPLNGQDALRAAFSGGSTADGRELRDNGSRSSRRGGKTRPGNPHRMAIRGADGRVIKDRLRSVQVGEDAYFLRPDSLGVADGVGGWASRPGADPALFSRLLMHFCAVELSRYDGLSASDLAANDGSMLKAWASVDPVEVMHRAWERCVRASRREGILGSSTALIALLRGDELRIANMGDCVLMIIRGGEMIFRSTEQQHSFNFPVQLGMMGDTTDTLKKHASNERAVGEGEISGSPLGGDSEALEDYDDVEDDVHASDAERGANDPSTLPPGVSNGENGSAEQTSNANLDDEPAWDEPRRDAGRWTVRVEAGDIIVVGSDGLMDNLFDEDIMEEVIRFLPKSSTGEPDQQQLCRNGTAGGSGLASSHQSADGGSTSSASTFSPQLVSEALCSRAKAVSEDSRAISSPFQQRAIEEGLNYVGGKHDDISVLVCLVGERDLLDTDERQAQSRPQGHAHAETSQTGSHTPVMSDRVSASSSSNGSNMFFVR